MMLVCMGMMGGFRRRRPKADSGPTTQDLAEEVERLNAEVAKLRAAEQSEVPHG